jgi:hypothetical protein
MTLGVRQLPTILEQFIDDGEALGDRERAQVYKYLLPRVLDTVSVASLLERQMTTREVRCDLRTYTPAGSGGSSHWCV